jgi:hypothetical protein
MHRLHTGMEVGGVDRNEAVRLASAFAARQGQDVARYGAYAVKTDEEWTVRFQPLDEARPRPGDFFTVHVDDRTGSIVRIVQGK